MLGKGFKITLANNVRDPQNEQGSTVEQDTVILSGVPRRTQLVALVTDTVEQDTVILPVPPPDHGRNFTPFRQALDRLPGPMHHLLISLLHRAGDPQPEAYDADRQDTLALRLAIWGWLPWLAFASALGMALIAYAFASSRDGGTGLRIFFYPGLLLIFAPTVLRLLSPAPSRTERIGLLCVVGVCCYFIKVMGSPLYFSFYNEFLHWRTADDIARGGHLLTQNVLLPVSSYYPGLEIVTDAFSRLSGIDTFSSGLVVIGVARLLLILALFALNEQLFKSARMASIATILYMANPHFLLYDSQFAYESLALPLAVFVLLATTIYQSLFLRFSKSASSFSMLPLPKAQSRDLRRIMLTAWLALLALTFTHHITDFYTDAMLVIWALVYGFGRSTPFYRSNIARTALFGLLVSVAWVSFNGNPVVSYLSSNLADALNELGRVLAGTSSSRQLFVTYSGQPTLLWERVVAALSVVLVMVSLPFGLLCLWRRYRSQALLCTFGLISLLYPISQIFRLTNVGGNLPDRAAAFLFIPIASVLAIFITQFWPTRRLNRKKSALMMCAVSIIFLGGFIIGAGPGLSTLPGPYDLGDPRAIEPEGIQAAQWAHAFLGPDNRVGTDLINQVLMGTYGDESVLTSADIAPIFFSSRLGPGEVALLRRAKIRYLVVDLRLSHSLPLSGTYFAQTEPGAGQHTTPMSIQALTKFNTLPQVNRVFDSGDIVIYDVGELVDASKKP